MNLGNCAGFTIQMEIFFYAYGELEISRYLTYRAGVERVPMTLTDDFFVSIYMMPIPATLVFGIQMGDEDSGFGDVISDESHPQLLLDFREFEAKLFLEF
jgi:hypothetical protein